VDLHVLMKQAKQLGVKARWASNQLDDPVSLEILGEAAIGAIVVSQYSPEVDTPQNKVFVEKWHKKLKDTKYPGQGEPAGFQTAACSFSKP